MLVLELFIHLFVPVHFDRKAFKSSKHVYLWGDLQLKKLYELSTLGQASSPKI